MKSLCIQDVGCGLQQGTSLGTHANFDSQGTALHPTARDSAP